MINLDLSNLGISFVQNTGFDFSAFDASSSTFYSWTTSGGHTIVVRGEGITTSGGVPTGGTITDVEIEMSGSDPFVTDITIDGLDDISLVDLDISTVLDSGDRFWRGVLDGEVEVTGPISQSVQVRMGLGSPDFAEGLLLGHDSEVNGDFGSSTFITGSAINVSGGTVIGASMEFTGSAFAVWGEVRSVSGDAVIVGGDDIIVSISDNSRDLLFGDVEDVSGTARIIGGDDTLDARDFTGGQIQMFGDAGFMNSDDAYLVGGDDIFYGSENEGTLTRIWADSYTVSSSNTQGGDDLIYGGASDGELYGDWFSPNADDVPGRIGGNDTIYAGDGADEVYGGGGNDRLYTGGGDDSVFGGSGDDRIFIEGEIAEVDAGDDDDLVIMTATAIGDYSIDGGDGIDKITYYRVDEEVNFTWLGGGDGEATSDAFDADHIVNGFEEYSGSDTERDRVVTDGVGREVSTNGGDDVVTSAGFGDIVDAGDGDDIVRAGDGANTYDGGDDLDTLSYSQSDDGIRIDLRDDEASGGYAEGDMISNFERVNGSNIGEDTLLGTDTGNIIKGLDGDDRVFGRGGTDKLYGGDGDDDFHFDKGGDRDVIKDFENNVDTIELDGFSSSLDWRDFATQDGDDVVLDFGGGDIIVVEDALIGWLSNDLILV